MFQAVRILPVLAVLAAVALVGKAGGVMFAVVDGDEAERDERPPSITRALADIQPMADEARPTSLGADGMVPRSVAEAPLALPPSPEALIEPAAGADEAEASDESGEAETAALDETDSDGPAPPSNPVRDPFDMSDEELELLQRLVERREALSERSRKLDERESLLEATEARIADKMNELKELQAVIESLLVQYDEEEEARLQSLVKIYESMKPKDAARIFEELDILVLLDVIGRMKERKSAPILAKMNPTRAKTVTLELAQRRTMPFARQ